MRLSRPIGIVTIYCPYLFGTIFAAAVSQPPPSPASILNTNLVLLIATVFSRGGAVAFNDLADRDLDGKIARTRHRPLARKASTPLNGYIFVAAQAVIWLAIQVDLSQQCIKYALPLLVFVGLCAYSKRVINLSPVPLGFTIGWGVLLDCAAMVPLDWYSMGRRPKRMHYAASIFHVRFGRTSTKQFMRIRISRTTRSRV